MSKVKDQNRVFSYFIGVALFIAINLIASYIYVRYDLTAEKRYTISGNSKTLLKSLDKPVFIKLYLSGDLNTGFRYLSKTTIEMFEEMELISGTNFRYSVVDPANTSNDDHSVILKELKEMGVEAVPVFETLDDGSRKQSMVYPYFKISLDENHLVVNLLENLPGYSGAENLNKSIEMLEFKIVDGIRKLKVNEKPKIAFLEGHGELNELEVIDVTRALSQTYQVERGAISTDGNVLNGYKCVIIAGPTKPFSENDKFVLNQYVMQGGNLLCLVDGISLSLDSLMNSPVTIGFPLSVNLEDLLFNFGFRVNGVALQDVQCSMIPVNIAKVGEAPKFVPAPWYFNPLLLPAQNSSITKNINVVKGEFVSLIDTVGDDLKLNRKVILATSRFSKISPAPVEVSLLKINEAPDKPSFNRSFLPVAVLAEGSFPSAFQYRQPPVGLTNAAPAVAQSKPAKMVVVADADVIRNNVRFKDSQPQIIALGYDEFSHQTYGNKEFIVNSVNYLCDDMGWMELRNRNNKLRLLDKAKISDSALFYKLMNVALPLILLVISGLVVALLRRR